MKQTLESAAKQNAEIEIKKALNVRATAERSFIAGAEWHAIQSPWISINDSFPEDNALVLCSSQIYGKVVLRWNKLAKEWLYPEENHIYCDWDKVDCWMYIPKV